MWKQIEITLAPKRRGCHLITAEIMRQLPDLPQVGLMNILIKHTSAALTINENADPDVQTDLAAVLDRLVKEGEPYYRHTMEGDDDMPAHAKASLLGPSLTVSISNGRLNLGIWQCLYLCEFRNYGGSRKLIVTITGE